MSNIYVSNFVFPVLPFMFRRSLPRNRQYDGETVKLEARRHSVIEMDSKSHYCVVIDVRIRGDIDMADVLDLVGPKRRKA